MFHTNLILILSEIKIKAHGDWTIIKDSETNKNHP